MSSLDSRYSAAVASYDTLVNQVRLDSAQLDHFGEQIEKVRAEQSLLEDSKTVLADARKLITKSSLEYCERLATVAARTIFNIDAEIKYEVDDGKFYLIYSDGLKVDIATSESGGVKTVLSFVFSLYLVMKSGSRRLMFYDEAWTQVSAEYMPQFIAFVKQVCHELGFSICLISHDERIPYDDVDRAYFMENGKCRRVK